MKTDDVKTEPAKTPEPKKAEAPAAAPKAEPLYIAESLILFNNEEYKAGDPIPVTGSVAQQLLETGSIRELKKKESK